MTLNVQTSADNRLAKTISPTQVKNQFGSVVEWTIKHNEGLVVESRGVPKVAIVPHTSYQEFLKLKEEARRQTALETLKRLRQDIQKRNPEWTDETAKEFADEVAKEVMDVVLEKRSQQYG